MSIPMNENINIAENGNTQTQLGAKSGKIPRTSRPVLGVINPNVNAGRVQPFRAAKQNATTEGYFSEPKQPQAFKIFEDTKPHKKPEQNDSKMLQNLATLPGARVPLSNISLHETPTDSPMVLDVSGVPEDGVVDIDHQSSLFYVSEYANEIFEHLRAAEIRNRPKAKYMRKQQDITSGMRAILVDWLVEVSEEYKLHTETTHLAVNYIDRFLSQMAVLRGKLQLVGTAAMFLAAKYEEIYPPDVGEFVYITDDTYTKKQVLRMEHLVLKVLAFDVAVVTSHQFLPRFLKAANANKKVEMLSMFLCELALVDYDCIGYLPSMIAASAVCLASFIVDGKIWDNTMEHYMQYKLPELSECIIRLNNLFIASETSPQQAVRDKYKDPKYESVSSLTPAESLPFDNMDDN